MDGFFSTHKKGTKNVEWLNNLLLFGTDFTKANMIETHIL